MLAKLEGQWEYNIANTHVTSKQITQSQHTHCNF